MKKQTPCTNGHSERVIRGEQTQEKGIKGQDTSEEKKKDKNTLKKVGHMGKNETEQEGKQGGDEHIFLVISAIFEQKFH